MDNEVTYADLKFQDSFKPQRIQEFDNSREIEHPAPSPAWRWSALGLLTLCLLLLIGLASLGILFFQAQKTNIRQLNGLEKNLSLQLEAIAVISKEKETIQSNLTHALQEMATQLCRELTRSKPDHACKPCPETWFWHEKSCYGASIVKQTWEDSREACAAVNSSLVKIDNKEEWDFIASLQNRQYHWVGLYQNPNGRQWEWEDGSALSRDLNSLVSGDRTGGKMCAYTYGSYFYIDPCTDKHYYICEKVAGLVKKLIAG
ncbi:C-type lectin domain family 12 member B-like isoform X2 [Tachyglossus aculeatus]|uniref:C-type lectin domain family 12 member B-like isoform X2 n=1 Tax=Tachyglossus aculeatus TaxID=9261 RepID=UPI0018F48A2D|nr:C-type lectin domain family 12 member B-like isoform X2 [Tachyglossus aculeatus]